MTSIPQKSFTPSEILRGDFVTWGLSIRDSLPDYSVKTAISDYRRTLRAEVRGFWAGVINLPDFMTDTASAIDRSFKKTWAEGMRSCGLVMSEMTPEEQVYLTTLIRQEYSYISKFAVDIMNGSKANKGKLAPLLARVDVWVNRLNYVRSQAKTMSCSNMKGLWGIGTTEMHCDDCLNYNTRIYRFSVWRKYLGPADALPQGRGLQCQGYRCDCGIEVTTDPSTPGFPPKPIGPKKRKEMVA